MQKCVHCGFCNATCPTYQLLGDELDGPRGRIYLMKSMLEGNTVSGRTQLHLDRCLTCRSCESTCPSGVRYGRLLEIGRELAEQQVRRSSKDRLVRFALRKIMTSRKWFGLLSRIGRWVRPDPAACYREDPSGATKRRSNSFDTAFTANVATGWLCSTGVDSRD